MPWKVTHPMDLKKAFVARLDAGERMTDLCAEYGISRQAGYELWRRWQARGVDGLLASSRAPLRSPHRTPAALVDALLAARRAHPTWGPKKLKHVLESQLGTALPAPSTIGSLLARHGLVERRRRKRADVPPHPHGLRPAAASNDVWCIDYKGQFRLGDGTYCYPLTLTDQHSRFVLACEGMAAIEDGAAREACATAFRAYGLPACIRSDNGPPFAARGVAGLTRLAVYWLRLGIARERIEPGHPEQNGRHERMHRTLKGETARPARANLLQQQERLDDWRAEFNAVRPHEALGQRPPGAVYVPSTRPYPATLPEPAYPLHDDVLVVGRDGWVSRGRGRRSFLSAALAGQPVGVREEPDGRWLVTFMDLDLGYLNDRTRQLEPLARDATEHP
jgi:transposase InsO family protein